MNRLFVLRLAALLIGAPAVAHAQTQIYPGNNAPGGPIVVAVVADHYGPQDQATFTRDARNVVVRGLLADPDFATLAGQVTVLAYFDPWTGPAESPSSKYGFEVEAGVTNCSISWTANTDALVDNVADDRNPLRTIVVGNYGYVFGCTSGQWTYVTAGAVGQPVLQHEFGHLLARLFDEYVLSANTSAAHPTMIPAADRRNCSTQVPPHWGTASPFTNDAGCDYFGLGVVRPTLSCRMGKIGSTFCKVCRDRMDEAVQFQITPPAPPMPPSNLVVSGAGLLLQTAPQPAPTQQTPTQPSSPPQPTAPPPATQPQPILRILVALNRSTNAASVQRVTDSTGRYVPSYQRNGGTLAYEITDAGRVIDVGVLPADLFQARVYRGATQQHGVEDRDTASVVIRVPNETVQRLSAPNRAVQIAFYRLDPSIDNALVTPDVLARLRTSKQAVQVSAISPAELRRTLK